MLGKIFDWNQNSFFQQKNVIAQTGQLHSNIIGPFCKFYQFCTKTFLNVFPELKLEDKIIIYGTIVILELKKLENVIAIFFLEQKDNLLFINSCVSLVKLALPILGSSDIGAFFKRQSYLIAENNCTRLTWKFNSADIVTSSSY